MRKGLFIFLMFILVLSSICYAQLKEVDLEAVPLKTLAAINSDPALMPKTLVNEDNTASVAVAERTINIDKFEAYSDEEVKMNIESVDTITKICFDFDISTEFIDMEDIRVNVPLWFDINLKDKEVKTFHSICYENISIDTNDLTYNIKYYPLPGMPEKIKYNINADGLILDPYVIGTLGTSNYLLLSMPFNGNSNVNRSVISQAVVGANVRPTTIYSYTPNAGGWISEANVADGSYASYGYLQFCSSGNYGNVIFEYNKNASDSGAIFQSKIGTTTQTYTLNYTVTSNCFNAYTNLVKVKAQINQVSDGGGYQHLGYQVWCDSGSGTYSESIGLFSSDTYYNDKCNRFYESTLFLTNQSNFSAFAPVNVKTQYYNTRNLVWSNSFSFWGNDSVQGLRNEINSSQTGVAYNTPIFNDSGVNFNGIYNSQYIQTRFNLTNRNFTVCGRFNYMTSPQADSREYIFEQYGLASCFISSGITLLSCANTSDAGELSISPVIPNKDYHFCYQGNTSYSALYLNGIIQQYTLNPFKYSVLAGVTKNFTIGTRYDGLLNFNGSIKDIKIYNRVLSSEEIFNLYKGGNFSTNKLGEANSSIYFNNYEMIKVRNDSQLNNLVSYSTSQWLYALNAQRVWNTPAEFLAPAVYYSNGNIVVYYNLGYGSWHNIITTTNGSVFKYYYDGLLVNTSIGSSSYTWHNEQPLAIGSDNSYITNFYNGYMSNFMLYNYVLTSEEIETLYHGFINANFEIYDEDTNALLVFPTNTKITLSQYCNNGQVYSQVATTSSFLYYDRCPLNGSSLQKLTGIYDDNAGNRYYRTLLPSATNFNISNNGTTRMYFLIPTNSTLILDTFQIFDLTNQYKNISIYVTKNIAGVEYDITDDFTDVTNSIGAYLRYGEQYTIKIASAGLPSKVFGQYLANVAGIRVIQLTSIGTGGNPSGTYLNNNWYWNVDNATDNGRLKITYNSTAVSLARLSIYKINVSNNSKELIYTTTSTSDSGQFLYPTIDNTTSLQMLLEILNTSGYSLNFTDKYFPNNQTVLTLFGGEVTIPEMRWVLIILLSTFILIFGITSGSVGGIIFVALTWLFTYVEWLYKWDNSLLWTGTLGLALVIVVIDFFRGQTK